MTINLKVSREFVKYSDAGLDEFANGVITGLTGNTAFPTPPVPLIPPVPPDPKAPPDLTTLDEAFRDAIAAATGDPQDTAVKKTAREALLDGLRKDANYVQTQSSHSVETLLSSGYTATSTNHAQTPLTPPVIQELSNAGTTKLLLRLVPVANARSYHVQSSLDDGKTWQEGLISTQARRIMLTGLTPGTMYRVRVRAIGGSTGCSDWTESGSIMAT